MYTGNIIIVEMDMNPSSATYRQTRTRIEADALCQQYQCQMVKVSEYTDGDDTIEVYEDQSATSPTKGQRIEVVNQSTTAIYLTMYSKCEQIGYGDGVLGNSGYNIATQINANPYSSTYQQVRDDYRYKDTDACPLPNAEPIMNEYSHCKLVDYPASGIKGTNGKMIVEKYDANPYSLTYYDVISTEEVDAVECQAPDTADKQRVLCEYCELDNQGKNTGYHVKKFIHTNLFASEYNDHVNIIRGIDKVLCPKPLTNILRGTGNTNTAMEMSIPTPTIINVNSNGNWSAIIEEEITTLYNFITNGKTNLVSIDFTDVDMSGIVYMHRAFYDCQNLTSVNFDGCDLSSLTQTQSMFFRTIAMNEIDMSNCNIQSINNCGYMFELSSIKTANLSGWGTQNLVSTQGMFLNCSQLQSIDLSGWDLTNCNLMVNMFSGCSALTTIYARGCNSTTLMKLASQKPSSANIVTT